MNSKKIKNVDPPVSSDNDSFNFELWASEVRAQLLAVVQKRTNNI